MLVEAGLDLLGQGLTLHRRIGDVVQVAAERLTDLLDLGLELVSLEENDEDILVQFLTSGGVDNQVQDLSVTKVQVTTSGAEQDTLENVELRAVDDSSNEAKLDGGGRSSKAFVVQQRG